MIWGLDVTQLHDRFWSAHGVCVVRRGEPMADEATVAQGQRTYLLIGEDDLVIAELGPAVSRAGRKGITALHLFDGDRESFGEEVERAPDGRLVAMRRRYASTTKRANPVYVTRRIETARAWAMRQPEDASARALRLAAGPSGVRNENGNGHRLNANDQRHVDRCLAAIEHAWPDLPSTFKGVKRLRRGVWAHEDATIASGARIIAPAWIGAGVDVPANGFIAGPAMITDARAVEPPAVKPVSARPLPSFDLPKPPKLNTVRRTINVVLSAMGILVSLPLYPFIMLAIWLEDGRPFFFAHMRQTRGGRKFTCHKFRTMHRNAEARRRALEAMNVCDGPQFHIENDPRLLRSGKFLRRFHLDELPQLWDVLKGDMDLIGPRPSPDEENQCCPAWREARLSVNPGLTGLWQVKRTRAPSLDFQEWIRYDLEYIDRRTWWLDIAILWRTGMAVIGGVAKKAKRKAAIRTERSVETASTSLATSAAANTATAQASDAPTVTTDALPVATTTNGAIEEAIGDAIEEGVATANANPGGLALAADAEAGEAGEEAPAVAGTIKPQEAGPDYAAAA